MVLAGFIGLVLTTVACEPATTARSYYVSPSGDDAGVGGPTTPWRTLQQANQFDFGPGDRLLLQGGASFSGTLVLTEEDAGLPTAPLTIGSFGTGRATIDAGAGRGVNVYNAPGIVVRDLRITGAGRDAGGDIGVLFFTDLPDDVLLPHVRLRDLEVSGFRDWGISIGSWNGRSGFRDVRVERVHSHDNGIGGMLTYAAAANVHRDIYVGASRFSRNLGRAGLTANSGNGLALGSVDGALVERSVAHGNGGLNTAAEGGVGIWAYDATRVVFQHNESFANRTGGPTDGDGFDFDHNVSASTMQFNYAHDNDGAGFLLCHGPDDDRHTGNVVRYNVSQDDGRRNGHGSIETWGRIRNTSIHHNTVSTSPVPSGRTNAVRIGGEDPNDASGLHLYNNIVRASGGATLISVSASQLDGAQDLVLRGNVWTAPGGSPRFEWGTRSYGSLSGWRSATGQELADGRPTGTDADPRLLSPGTAPTVDRGGELDVLASHYSLAPSSPARDTGVALDLYAGLRSPVDLTGRPSVEGAAADPGAFELQATTG